MKDTVIIKKNGVQTAGRGTSAPSNSGSNNTGFQVSKNYKGSDPKPPEVVRQQYNNNTNNNTDNRRNSTSFRGAPPGQPHNTHTLYIIPAKREGDSRKINRENLVENLPLANSLSTKILTLTKNNTHNEIDHKNKLEHKYDDTHTRTKIINENTSPKIFDGVNCDAINTLSCSKTDCLPLQDKVEETPVARPPHGVACCQKKFW
eukprot:GHVR01043949.1.p1 GENE.GHVR01043949.1~~GHVR01043949.1.p1  ORF type:complete len:204 (-),score=50.41 GHVR01043949.1:79-690(-)